MAKPERAPARRRTGRPRKGEGEVVSARRWAKIAGVRPQTVEEWIAAGLPAERAGNGPWQIRTALALRWHEDQARDAAARPADKDTPANMLEAELRKAVADAELAELKLARLRGEVVPIEEYGKELRRVLGRVRGRIAAVPGEYAPRILEPLDMPRAVALLRELTTSLLQELQRAGAPPAPDAPAAEEGAA